MERSEEFSPLKNADPPTGSDAVPKDCPITCRRDLAKENARWISAIRSAVLANNKTADGDAAGIAEKPVYVSPLLSYAGEGLTQQTRFELVRRDDHLVLVPAAPAATWASSTCTLV